MTTKEESFKRVAAALIVVDSEVLLCRRSVGESLEGFWEFPGGVVEKNESAQECLEREIWEELGLEIAAGPIVIENFHQYDRGTIQLIAIVAKIVSGEIELSVHDKYEWVSIKDLMTYKLAPADIPVAKHLMENEYV